MAKSSGSIRRNAWFETRTADAILALAVTVLGQIELRSLNSSTPQTVAVALLLLAQTAPIALRRTLPLAGVAINVTALTVEALTVGPGNTLAGLISGLVLTYSAGRWCSAGHRLSAAVLILAGITVHVARMPNLAPGDVVFVYLFTAVAWLAGGVLRSRLEESEKLALERDAEIAARQERERRMVTEERARIARELHDVVAHGLTLMVVQAGAAEGIVTQRPHEASRALAIIRETGRDSLAEMRRLLGLLRESSDIDSTANTPGLGEVSDLVSRAVDSGQQISLQVSGVPAVLSPGLDVSAYRIVQEALTNARRHGDVGLTELRINYLPDEVVIDVTNQASSDEGDEGDVPDVDSTGGPTSAPDAGFGLIGISERVALFGGALEVGPTSAGSFRVHVTLPTAGAIT